jgi:hypothetical protein
VDHLGAKGKIGEVLNSLHKVCILNENAREKPFGMLIVGY